MPENYEKHASRVSQVIAAVAKVSCKHGLWLVARVKKDHTDGFCRPRGPPDPLYVIQPFISPINSMKKYIPLSHTNTPQP